MVKAKLFHAGRGIYEVRYRKAGRVYGVGTFFSKVEAERIIKKLNKRVF